MHRNKYLVIGIRNVIKKAKSSKPRSWSTDANKHNFDASQMILNTKLFQLIPSLHFPWKNIKCSVVCLLVFLSGEGIIQVHKERVYPKWMRACSILLIKVHKPYVCRFLTVQYKQCNFQCFSGCEFLKANESVIHFFCDRKLEVLMLESLYHLRRPFLSFRKSEKPLKATSNTYQLKSCSGV